MESGRRESNPQPTAWKAVTLPLSYSRPPSRLPRCACRRYSGQAHNRASRRCASRRSAPTVQLASSLARHLHRPAARRAKACGPPSRSALGRDSPPLCSPLTLLRLACRAVARSPVSERRLMAREGFEPSKALGRQIYSLLRLTASLPRRSSRESATEHAPPLSTRPMTCQDLPLCEFLSLMSNRRSADRPDSWSWRRDLNPRPADYKSAALPD